MKIGITNIFVLLFLLIVFLYKPTTIGAILTPIAMVLTFLCIVFHKKASLRKSVFLMSIAAIMFYTYIFMLDAIKMNTIELNYYKAAISIITLIIGFDLSLSKIQKELFKKYFILLLCFFSLSCICSIFLCSSGANVESLEICRFHIEAYDYNLTILFPFTPYTGVIPFDFLTIPRLSALFRECGIAQLFYCWAIAESDYYFNSNKLVVKFLLYAGAICCLSTAGFVSLFLLVSLKFVYKLFSEKISLLKILTIPILFGAVLGLYWLVQFAPIIGMENKNQTSSDARLGNIDVIFNTWTQSPSNFIFGAEMDMIGSAGTAFYQRFYYIGLLGVILYALIIYFGYRYSKNHKRFILANVAGIVTALMAQPIWDAAILILLWTMPYSDDDESNIIKAKLSNL